MQTLNSALGDNNDSHGDQNDNADSHGDDSNYNDDKETAVTVVITIIPIERATNYEQHLL